MSRIIRAGFATALAIAGLTGCAGYDNYAVRDQHATQDDVIGDVVRVGGTFCLDNQVVSPDAGAGAVRQAALAPRPAGDAVCDPAGGADVSMWSQDAGVQFFAAFLVPDGAQAPATATATLPPGFSDTTATLRRKPSLDETLDHTRPAPDGRRWVGYISPVLGAASKLDQPAEVAAHLSHAANADAPADVSNGDWSAQAAFHPARGENGMPSPAVFSHAILGGARVAYPESIYDGVDPAGLDETSGENWGLTLLDSRPVDCQEYRAFPFWMVFGQSLSRFPTGDLGLPLIPTTGCGITSTDGSLPIKDLRGSGGVASAAPGETATIPFTLRYAGEAGPTFALTATSALAGATVTPSASSLTPAGPGFQDVGVKVTVPQGAAPGDYAVDVTAAVGDQVRKARGTLTVPKPAVVTPVTGAAQETGVVQSAGTTPLTGRPRMVEFRGFDRSGVGPDGGSINLGDVLCHKTTGSCGYVTIQLTVRWDQLHRGAQVAARRRMRMVTIGTGRMDVPAGSRRRVRVTLPRTVAAMLRSGEVLEAVAAVRPAYNRVPLVHRITLRKG